MSADGVKLTGSIRRRLMVQLVGSAAILALVLFAMVRVFAQQVAQDSQDNILIASVTSILDSATVQFGEISLDIPYSALSMLGTVSDDRVFYRITTDGVHLTGYADLPDASPDDLSPAQPGSGHNDVGVLTSDYRGESVRVVTASRQMSLNGAPAEITATVAQTRNGLARTLALVSRNALWLGVGFFFVATSLAALASRSALRPLRKLAGAVSRRGPKDLRPVNAPVPAEMGPLVASLNQFIRRLRFSLARSEDFIAEAAHRVRTPLATVRAQAEVALHRVERPENRKSLREMIRAIDECSRAAGQLLDHAMVSFRTDHLEREQIDLGDLTSEVAERLRPVAGLKDIRIEITHEALPGINGDAILIQNAVRNVLDNAIKYSPDDRRIDISFYQSGGSVEIRITDEGKGLPGGNTDTLTDRFVRGENASDTVGSGLGLTIAREVAEAHGGHLIIRNNSEGPGACVSLYFPSS